MATVIAVFMGGLAIGSALIGRWSERTGDPIKLYGWLEVGVAVTAALSLPGLLLVRVVYPLAFQLAGGWMPLLFAIRFLGAGLVLFAPTFLMGGTLPVLAKAVAQSPFGLAGIGRLYAVNTLGAVSGTLLAGFVLLPFWGLRRTIVAAVALNLIAGAIAWRRIGTTPARALQRADALDPFSRDKVPPRSGFLLSAFAIVGATAIAYEICLTRLLTTTLGGSAYAFTLMLAAFLSGLALGSALFDIYIRRGGSITLRTFALTQLGIAGAALGFLLSFEQFPVVVHAMLNATEQSFRTLLGVQALLSVLAMLPAALIFGFNFPIVTLLIAGSDNAGRSHAALVGCAYAANTTGAIFGAVLTGFWLLPSIGAFRLVACIGAVNLALALVLSLGTRARAIPIAGASAVLLALVLGIGVGGFSYDRNLATFGSILYSNLLGERLTPAETAATNDVLFATDGVNASISVVRAENYLGLRTNGKVDASSRDVVTQLMLGHLGTVFHPAPRRVLVIGFGSGMTAAALARYPEIEHITVVEIEPAVIRAAPYLERLNAGVLRDPRVHIVLDDARNFLLATDQHYDLIVSEPSNPWIAGVATLFTDEFYREARRRLTPDGMFVQWVQAYSLFPEDLRMVLGTFAPHFATVTLWRGEAADFLLLGQANPGRLTLERLRGLWNVTALAEDFRRLGLDEPEGLLAFHLLDDQDVRRFAASARVNSDDHTRLEYNAPRALLTTMETENRALVSRQRSQVASADVMTEGAADIRLAAAETLLNLNEPDEAGRFLESLDDQARSSRISQARGRLALQRHDHIAARDAFQDAIAREPDSLAATRGLADASLGLFDDDRAEQLYLQVLARAPDDRASLEGLARSERERKNWRAATQWQERVIASTSEPRSEDYEQLGDVQWRGGLVVAAAESFARALQLEPYSYAAHRSLGEIYRHAARWDEARSHLEHVVRFDPGRDSAVYTLLAQVYRGLSRAADADAVIQKGRRIFPHMALE